MFMQVYIKLQSNCLLFSDESNSRHEKEEDTVVGMGMEQKTDTTDDSDDDDDDDVWNGMETVTDNRKRVKSESYLTYIIIQKHFDKKLTYI